MAWTPIDLNGGTSLKAAGLVAADTAESGVRLNHSDFCLIATWSAAEIATGDELYIVVIEANTQAATSTWTQIGVLAVLGHTSVIGGVASAAATGAVKAAFHNPYDYQVRVKTWVNGTIATGLNMTVKAFPLQALSQEG